MPIGHYDTSFCEQYELEEAAAHLLYAYLFTGLGGEDVKEFSLVTIIRKAGSRRHCSISMDLVTVEKV